MIRTLSSNRSNYTHHYSLPLCIAFILLSMTILAACGQADSGNNADDSSQVDLSAEEQQPVEIVVPEPEPEFPFTYPLTGIGADIEITQRPLVILVENQAKARPQDGLHKADIVYEVLAEGEITRFVSVFHSQTADVIGPVRSLRPYFAQIAHGLDGLIVHAGWSQEGINYVNKYKLPHFDQVYGDDAYYWRDSSRKAPHNLYTKSELLYEGAVKKKFREAWNEVRPKFIRAHSDAKAIQGEPATKVKINYIAGYYVGYEYDAAAKRYNRTMLGEPHKDKTSETQITADNVLVIYTKHKVVDNVGRRHVNVEGPGSGLLIQSGQAREVTWQNKEGLIRPYILDEEVPLLPGQTWVQIIPEGSKVEYQ
jgi:hypothetical protein